jgi:DNA-binding beta-propeller fold protein YncE
MKTVPVGYSPIAIAVNPNTNTVYVRNADHSISVIDGKTNTVNKTIITKDRGNEGQIAVNPNTNRVYYTVAQVNATSIINGAISVMHGKMYTVVKTLSVGLYPLGVAVDPTTNTVYVVNTKSNTVPVIPG